MLRRVARLLGWLCSISLFVLLIALGVIWSALPSYREAPDPGCYWTEGLGLISIHCDPSHAYVWMEPLPNAPFYVFMFAPFMVGLWIGHKWLGLAAAAVLAIALVIAALAAPIAGLTRAVSALRHTAPAKR